MIFDSLPIANRATSVEIDAHRVEVGEDSDDGQRAATDEGEAGGFGAEVEDRGCDRGEDHGKFELWALAWTCVRGGGRTHARNVLSAAK